MQVKALYHFFSPFFLQQCEINFTCFLVTSLKISYHSEWGPCCAAISAQQLLLVLDVLHDQCLLLDNLLWQSEYDAITMVFLFLVYKVLYHRYGKKGRRTHQQWRHGVIEVSWLWFQLPTEVHIIDQLVLQNSIVSKSPCASPISNRMFHLMVCSFINLFFFFFQQGYQLNDWEQVALLLLRHLPALLEIRSGWYTCAIW